ncbi:MAG: hypothetical protein AB1564_06375 [Chloroflexota bacterium]
MRLTVRFAVSFFALLLLASLAVRFAFQGPYPDAPGPHLTPRIAREYLQEIKSRRPQILLLGDSMLTKDVDADLFQAQVGLATYKLDVPGSASALWYLLLEHNILPADEPPQTVVILFRDGLLTAPSFRADGPYFGMLDKYSSAEDTLFLQLAYVQRMSLPERALDMFLPPYSYRVELLDALGAFQRHVPPSLLGCDTPCADAAFDSVLRSDIPPEVLSSMILDAEQELYSSSALDFDKQVAHSFLPEIIGLAEERGIRLIFVRAPTNLFPNPAAEPNGLETYIRDLQTYLIERGILFLDIAHTPHIRPEHFSDPHHMTPEGKAIFTQVLAVVLRPLLEE